jgi:hypothetical protein
MKTAFNVLGGTLTGDADTPSAESLVGWLLEHQDLSSDSESLSDVDDLSGPGSVTLDEYDDFEGLLGEAEVR